MMAMGLADMGNEIKITFGMIVLNGEPFVRYNLRALYPFAHQIIVVEGSCPAARGVAGPDGHSKDGTLETLARFSREEDPENKILILRAEDDGHPDGFWPGEKDEMSQAYAKRATGKWLWQVDADEFYLPEDMSAVIRMLESEPTIREVSFRVLTFWGAPDCLVDGLFLRRGDHDFHRLFAWGEGYRYITHRPPTVADEKGNNLRELKTVSAGELATKGIFLYHYELLFPKQVREKCSYYAKVDWTQHELKGLIDWVEDCYTNLRHPYRVHMVYRFPSWLERYGGCIPPAVLQMTEAVRQGQHPGVLLRQTGDIEELLNSAFYLLGRGFLKAISVFYKLYYSGRKTLGLMKRSLLRRRKNQQCWGGGANIE